jgi:methionyl-tRNA formyltransferase
MHKIDNKITNSGNLVVFGYSQITKSCIKSFLDFGYKITLFCPKEKINLFNKFKFSKLNIEYFIYNDLKEDVVINKISQLNPDYIFTIIFGYKLPENIIALAKKMALNYHPSILPDYRSANPYFWVVRRGETISGVTVHKLTQKFDSGNIVYQKKFALSDTETLGTYVTRVDFYSKYIVEELHKLMSNNDFQEIAQSGGPYYPKVKYRDVAISWNQSAKEIEALVRACNPFPGALAYYRNMVLKVMELELAPFAAGQPGEIMLIEGDLFISARDYYLKVNIIESPKEGIFSGKRFASFCGIKSGEFFTELAQYLKQEELDSHI